MERNSEQTAAFLHLFWAEKPRFTSMNPNYIALINDILVDGKMISTHTAAIGQSEYRQTANTYLFELEEGGRKHYHSLSVILPERTFEFNFYMVSENIYSLLRYTKHIEEKEIFYSLFPKKYFDISARPLSCHQVITSTDVAHQIWMKFSPEERGNFLITIARNYENVNDKYNACVNFIADNLSAFHESAGIERELQKEHQKLQRL